MRRVLAFMMSMVVMLALAAPAGAGSASTDQVEDFVTGVVTSFDPFTVGEADCAFVKRVEKPNGSAKETQQCQLTGNFFQFDEQGQQVFFSCDLSEPDCGPEPAFKDIVGECGWASDYWSNQAVPSTVIADSLRATFTPSGKVHATSTYPADPIDPASCG